MGLKILENGELEPLVANPAQAARLLGLGRTVIYELINAGEIKIIKVGTRTLIRVKDLEAFLERKLREQHGCASI